MLRAERDGEVLLLVLDRPRTKNALDESTLRAIGDAMATDARAIVLTGDHGAFCSGGDLGELRHRATAGDAERLSDLGAEVLSKIEQATVPVFAAIDGIAFGGGAELAMACDVRVAGDDARISFKHAKMGATTAWGTSARLLRTVGHGVASLLLLTAIEIDADRAFHLGLVEVRANSARAAALDLARRVVACGPHAVRELKDLLRAGGVRERERAAFVRTWSSEEHAAAISAFFAHRPRRPCS
jgi:enoyl-CoA hydratase